MLENSRGSRYDCRAGFVLGEDEGRGEGGEDVGTGVEGGEE
jgi:hypothetical protein